MTTMLKKVRYITKEMIVLTREHKLYFLSPILLLLCVLAILFFHFGPAIVISFIYAGV